MLQRNACNIEWKFRLSHTWHAHCTSHCKALRCFAGDQRLQAGQSRCCMHKLCALQGVMYYTSHCEGSDASDGCQLAQINRLILSSDGPACTA